ncbi:MAG: SufD family Fe-S cluster assembly protein [Actinobacteria bacterium]|nr:SufD family Fe-S cluster assembly protein [Actinomycetota bacterium]
MSATTAHSHSVPINIVSGTRSTDPADFPVISAQQEMWRFTPVAKLEPLEAAEFSEAQVKVAAPADVAVRTTNAPGRYVPTDRIAATTWSRTPSVTEVSISPEAVLNEPVKIDVALNGAVAQFVRVVIAAGMHSQAAVELTFTGQGSGGAIIELQADAGAHVTFTHLTEMSSKSTLVVHVPAFLGRDAVLRSHTLTLGGGLVRIVPTVHYEGPGADAQLSGAFIAGPGHHVEHRTLADHTVANCRSHVAYKGVLSGTREEPARSVWIGDVLIHSAATGTDTYELNRNLVMNEFARADSVPNLEIETGDIAGAGHASATGRLDDEQVFYLMSRGVDRTTATSLIVAGFFDDLLAVVPSEECANRVRERLAQVLA